MRGAHVLWIALVAALSWLTGPTRDGWGIPAAHASVAVALSLEELVDASDRAVVAVATARRCQWEQVDGSRRIVTYTTVEVTQPVFGEAPAELEVKTLGGVVGKIGQHVSGEAQLGMGERCLLFLLDVPGNAAVVVGRAQGHYPIVLDRDGRATLRPSPDRGRVLPRSGPSISAFERLVGQPLEGAITRVRKLRDQRDARR